MYVGRDLSELTMTSLDKWKKDELAYFHHSLQQVVPYMNAEGKSLNTKIIREIENRGGLKRNEADYTHGTEISYD